MEYSPGNAIPYISRVDAGTVEAVRQLGVEVASSGDLVQRFEAMWSREALQTHRAASRAALPDQGSGVRPRRNGAAGPGAADGDRRPAADGRLVQRGRPDQPTRRRSSRRRRTPAIRTTCRTPAIPAHRRRRGGPAGLVGQAAEPRRGLCRYHLGRVYSSARPGPIRQSVRRRARQGRDAAVALVKDAVGGRP